MAEQQAAGLDAETERAIRERGIAFLESVQPERLITLTPAWLQARAMAWAASDPSFRVRLLRFVDVLPTLRTPRAVADHVRQYFREDAPVPIRIGRAFAKPAAFRPALSRVVRQGVFSMAERFIAGETPALAAPALRDLMADGTAYTVDLLGEATLSKAEADEYAARYLELLAELASVRDSHPAADRVKRVNVSIKLSALTPTFVAAAPRATWDSLEERLLSILFAARDGGAFVNVDMEQFRYKDLTHRMFARAAMHPKLRDWDGLGIVVQAYLRDALADITRLEAVARERGTPITVRLVKGAYWDEEVVVAHQNSHAVPVWEQKPDTDRNYEECSALLIASFPHLRPAFASHHPRSIVQAMVRSGQAGLPQEQIEFQMLFGMAEGLRKAVASDGYPTRVYLPVGRMIPGMAYLVRRLLENTSNESWMMHRHEEADADEAFLPPVPSAETPSAEATGFRNHPPAELHLQSARRAMTLAIEAARNQPVHSIPLRIAGQSIRTESKIDVSSPTDPSRLLARVASAGANEVNDAVLAATKAFPSWRDTPAKVRARVLRAAADLIDERRYEFAATMVLECAKPWDQADGDVIEAIDFLRFYAAEAERLAAGHDLDLVPGESNRLSYEGRGVVAVIAPWNFPLAILAGMTGGALAAGCTVVMKPAEEAPVIASKLVQVLEEAGVPLGGVNYLPGLGEISGVALVEHPDIAMIAFTGSGAVGQDIMRRAAEVRPGQPRLKHVLAELGGKNAIIVDEDADLDEAVVGVVHSAFAFAGQKCSACSRVIVVGSALDEFRDRLAATVESLPVGDPGDPLTFVPPVISADAKRRVNEFIDLGLSEGRLVAKGSLPDSDGHFVAPHVFCDVPNGSRLVQEEVFGPVLTLSHVPDFGAAIIEALASQFGLTGGVYSRNPRNIDEARRRFRVGNLYINRAITGAVVGRQPFAGLNMSGTGDKSGGPDYVREFMVARVVTENTMRRGFVSE